MKKYHLFFLLVCVLVGCKPKMPEEIIVCGDDKALILDIEQSEGEKVHVVWDWNVADVANTLPEAYQKYLVPLDECKVVDGGKKILLTSSGGGVLLLDRASKACLFYAHVPMAHSAEWMPNHRIAVALSTHPKGNSIEIYDADRSESCLFRDSIYSGHGSVWMKEEQRLYVLGYSELRSYSLMNWESDSPALKLERTWKIPVESGHDLVRMTDSELLVTGHEGVFVFDTKKKVFTPFAPLKDRPNVKSVNYLPDLDFLVYTQAEIRWWTHHVYLENPTKVLCIEDIDLYKVRVIND